ncbi:MAG: Na+/H+ antiporter subunit D, partial [Nitrospiraceae bacterium]|nr:Na+/H+ antiporter subunit D [Nitrospiraceae bacterium]
MTGSALPPYLYYFAGALLLPLLPGRFLKRLLTLAVPIVGFIALLQIPKGSYDLIPFLNYHLTLMRVDKLSLIFSYVFVIMSFIGAVYALHIKEEGQMVAAFLYVGSTLGVTFAGDYFSLFFFWEIMAGASVFLVWFNRTEASVKAGYRYLLVHISGGCLLLAGILIHLSTGHSIAFNPGSFGSFASYFILAGFLVNAAVPPLHPWLPDAYPMGTITGSVFLTAYTTKSAVYVLCRGFSGVEVLMWLGAIMAIYGVVYAFIEVDMRKLLSYHIVSQVGYMVCGV